MTEWYHMHTQDAIEALESNLETGLNSAEAKTRVDKFGANELIDRGVTSPWKILFEQFTDTMVIVLIIAAVISGVLGEMQDAIAILVIVILNALLGFRQEYQAEQAMAALKKLAVPTVRVRRNGKVQEISSKELVRGDVVLLEAGNLVPADCRVLESVNLSTQEAALTGESEPVAKFSEYLPENKDSDDKSETPLAERKNMLFMGTIVSYGRGTALVTATGMHTELGSIAEMMQSAGQEDTPLQKRLDQLGKGLAVAAAFIVAIVFVLGWLRGEELKELFLTSISLAVAAIPEGLPAVVTIALALGARRMLRRRALIRKLPAVETLGSVTVICSDKTGTLTENRMTVTVLDVAENRIDLTGNEQDFPLKDRSFLCAEAEPNSEQQEALRGAPALTLLLAGGALCNDALLECDEADESKVQIVGDPTEGALLVAANQAGLSKRILEQAFPRVAEAPFSSERKRMTTVHQMPADDSDLLPALQPVWDWGGWAGLSQMQYFSVTKGAIDGLLDLSGRVWAQDHLENMDDPWRRRIEAANERLAKQGMRVLAVACKNLDELPKDMKVEELQDSLEMDLIFVGLFGMIDPARPEVKDAVDTCRTAGIRPVMITGDHPLTAGYIARELGIIAATSPADEAMAGTGDSSRIFTGRDLSQLDDQQLDKIVEDVSVYARVSPAHKLRIVEALQNRGHIVAMTGDGVNDAPALKKSDIGVAMGITGTDVSKEAADMVLLDDNFATIVASVKEGRVIYDNIRKFIQYTLTSNVGEIWVMLLAPFFGMPLPLLPLQILWINLVTDGLPGLALGVEKAESNTMRRPPYPPNENVFARGLGKNIMWVGLLMGLISLGVGLWYWFVGNPAWQTMVFTTLTLSEMGYVMAIRSNRDSIFKIGWLSNKALVGAVALTTVLQLAVVYVPFLQDIFNTVTLSFTDLAICILLSTSLFWAVELQKWYLRKRNP